MRMKKMPVQKKPVQYRGARLGSGWYEDYIKLNPKQKVTNDASST